MEAKQEKINRNKMKTEATHYIRCFESVGGGRKRILFQKCILIGYHGDDMVKVVVLEGVRGGSGGNVVYVNKNRLINMYVKSNGGRKRTNDN